MLLEGEESCRVALALRKGVQIALMGSVQVALAPCKSPWQKGCVKYVTLPKARLCSRPLERRVLTLTESYDV
jgi:hypothetical protein